MGTTPLTSLPARDKNEGTMKHCLIALLLALLLASEAHSQMAPDTSGLVRDQLGDVQLVQYAFVNPSTATTTAIVAAQGAGIRIRVLSAYCVPTLANNLTFNTAAAAISALFPVAANGHLSLGYNPHGWFQTNANEALNLVTSAATATGCSVAWIRTR